MTRSLLLISAAAALALAPAASRAEAPGEWGALALSERSTAYGYAYDFDSQDGATGRALAECGKNAGDCRIQTTFRNTCLVLAGSVDGPFGWAWGGAESTRQQRAMEQCRQRGAINCKVVETVCTGMAGGPARPRNPAARAPQTAPAKPAATTTPPATTTPAQPGAPTQLHKQ